MMITSMPPSAILCYLPLKFELWKLLYRLKDVIKKKKRSAKKSLLNMFVNSKGKVIHQMDGLPYMALIFVIGEKMA